MSLNWDVRKIKNYNVVTTHPDDRAKLEADPNAEVRWHPLTETLVWLCMAVGENSIDYKNWKRFYRRVYCYERVSGSMRRFYDKNKKVVDTYVTAQDVYDHIGLHTNVSQITDAQFAKKLVESAIDECNAESENVKK